MIKNIICSKWGKNNVAYMAKRAPLVVEPGIIFKRVSLKLKYNIKFLSYYSSNLTSSISINKKIIFNNNLI